MSWQTELLVEAWPGVGVGGAGTGAKLPARLEFS